MVCGRQARDPTRDHRHVVPAAVRRHDHARRIPDEHRIVLHRSRRRPHHRHEPTGRLTGLQAPRPDEPVEQTLQVPVEVLPRSQTDVRAMGLRDDPCVSSRGEVAEEHVRRVAEIAVRGRAHRGRGYRPLEAHGLRHGGARTVRADHDLPLERPVVRGDLFAVDSNDGRLRHDLRAFVDGLRRDPLIHPVPPDREPLERDLVSTALRRPDPNHGGVDLAHVIGDRHEILQSLHVRENRPNFLVVRDIFAALHGHADLLALVDEEDFEPASRRVPGGRSTRRPGADHNHVVRRWHSATSSRVARQDIIDEADHARLRIAVGDRVQGLLGELPIRLRVEPGLFDGAGVS